MKRRRWPVGAVDQSLAVAELVAILVENDIHVAAFAMLRQSACAGGRAEDRHGIAETPSGSRLCRGCTAPGLWCNACSNADRAGWSSGR